MDVLAIARGHRTMEQVVRWVILSKFSIEEIVIQDEYTHDVIVRVGETFLVYDTT